MKKSTRIALLVAAIMIAVGATLCNIARGRGEDIAALVNDGAFSVSMGRVDFGVSQKDYTVCTAGEESFAAEEIDRLDLSWISGEVNIEPHDGERILIREEARQTLNDSQRMRWKLSGGRLSVLFCANGAANVPGKTLTVLVPRDWIAEQITADVTSATVFVNGLTVKGELSVDTTSGEVSVEGCACESLHVSTTSGSVSVEATTARGDMEADTTSGAVRLKGCACEKLDVNTTSGGVSVEGTVVNGRVEADTTSGAVMLTELPAGCRVDVDSVSGDVTLSFAGRPGQIEIDTTSGAVTLRVPKGTELDLDFDSVSGKLSGSMTTAKSGVPVQVDTVSGNLIILEG